MTEKYFINNDWEFASNYDCEKTDRWPESAEKVRLPHSVVSTPFNYFDESVYQMVSGYKKKTFIPAGWQGKSIRITFEGVAHFSTLYINGKKILEHDCGYTAFTADISSVLSYGEENTILLRVDSNESLNQPPFGYVIDYMTYGGIYREAYLEVSEPLFIKDVFHRTNFEGDAVVLTSEIELSKLVAGVKLQQFLDGKLLASKVSDGEGKIILTAEPEAVELWDIENPRLYEIKTVLSDDNGNSIDEKVVSYGFRKSEFKKDGYYLNGKKVKIRGLNRHQSYPYVGYAMPASMQEADALILKKELGLNAVRTSHYPQSQAFIDCCDKIGLLVFTEIPGWQHIGNEEWKEKAVKNVEDMVLQYRNHPSIILWGVRINESQDDDEFYKRTNETAHLLDPTRPTGGVRAHKKSHLFEDVYTYNDFVHDGNSKGCEPKKKVTSDINKPYLVSEYNGHMYPTKNFDTEEHRREHALRHANVLEAVAKEEDIAGSFGWCMSDYNTHKDFGSGDRICYHGVLDMFRNPKPAALVYSCEQEKEVVLELSSTMDIGEHPGCNRGFTWIFSNADSVKMYKNGNFIKEYTSVDSPYKNLKHGPIMINDFIGDAIEKNEKGSKGFKRDLKEALNATALYGLNKLPKRILLKAAKMVLVDHMGFGAAVTAYNKYIGDWGGKSTVYRFEAISDGKVVKTLIKEPVKSIQLESKVNSLTLNEGSTYDVAAVRIRAVDDNGNTACFFNEPVCLEAEGEIEIIGPATVGLKGGMAGTYVKSTGREGQGILRIKNSQCEAIEIVFDIKKNMVKEL